MAKYSFEYVMGLKEKDFEALVIKEKKVAEWNEICGRTTTHKSYPKVLKPMKPTKKNRDNGTYNPEKMTWQADKSKKPTIQHKEITFFEAKTAFAIEVLKIAKKPAAAKKETFRDRAAKLAENN